VKTIINYNWRKLWELNQVQKELPNQLIYVQKICYNRTIIIAIMLWNKKMIKFEKLKDLKEGERVYCKSLSSVVLFTEFLHDDTTLRIKPGPKRIAESTLRPDRRQRDNKYTTGNTLNLTLTIQLSASNSIISRVTRWVIRGKFGHVDIILSNAPNILIGAHIFGGIKKTKFTENAFSKIKRYEIEVSQETINWVSEQIGRKYDLWAIFGFIFKIPVFENTASICSEFAFDVLEKSECFNHQVKFQSSKISPRDLNLVLQTLEATRCAKLLKHEKSK